MSLMDINVFRGLVTAVLLALFIWLICWAWSTSPIGRVVIRHKYHWTMRPEVCFIAP